MSTATRGHQNDRSHSYPPIAEYAVVGDCRTAALISRQGSVDWYCPGRFDAPAVFCRLLDAERGGYLALRPTAPHRAERRYREGTNVLETTYAASDGLARVTDFMPMARCPDEHVGRGDEPSGRLLRLAECLAGALELEVAFKPTFDYARAETVVTVAGASARARRGNAELVLSCPGVTLARDDDGVVRGRFRLRAGDRLWIDLAAGDAPAMDLATCDAALERTLDFWRRWTDACTYRGPYRDLVRRSALALKLLTHAPTGAVVAAPTTSLPENVGGGRNWDYRYTWLRDASVILYALLTVGYREAAGDFIRWLERTVGDDESRRPQILYRVDGQRDVPEQVLSHLEGYRGSWPVRIGNAAASQQQLDVYGEVLVAAYLYYRDAASRKHRGPDPAGWGVLSSLVDRAAEDWGESGNGIWEVRGGPQQFLYGKLMCWAALDRGVRLAQEHGLDAPVDRWQRAREAVRHAIETKGYDQQQGAFTQAFGSSTLDASALAIPRIGFLPPTDERVRSTVERIRQHLSRDGLVYRYRADTTDDGMSGREGTFLLCTYWMVDALALGGRLDEAHALFERVSGYANDVGLLSEEVDHDSGALLGNFPQGFSHMALIGAAVNLAKAAEHGPEHAAENEGERAERAQPAAASDSGHR